MADAAELIGYVPIDEGLLDLYRGCHALLHVSWTEGVPQILFEAFAAGLPVVATAVGGVPDAVGDDALLVPPGDAQAAASALARIAREPELRDRLVAGGWSGFAATRSGRMRPGGRVLQGGLGAHEPWCAGPLVPIATAKSAGPSPKRIHTRLSDEFERKNEAARVASVATKTLRDSPRARYPRHCRTGDRPPTSI